MSLLILLLLPLSVVNLFNLFIIIITMFLIIDIDEHIDVAKKRHQIPGIDPYDSFKKVVSKKLGNLAIAMFAPALVIVSIVFSVVDLSTEILFYIIGSSILSIISVVCYPLCLLMINRHKKKNY